MPLPQATSRIASLDQFRGYTVAGMFLVNFLGSFAACPRILRHTHDYCSYADTIMPQFLFAVGFAFRLTFERRIQREGATAAHARVIRRLLGLALLSLVIYVHSPLALTWAQLREMPATQVLAIVVKREWFQTLMHIAMTTLWIVPVIRASAGIRIGYALLSAVAHVALSAWFNFDWVNTSPKGIDGGPFGFLSWSIAAIAGTLACDLVVSAGEKPPAPRIAIQGIVLMLVGWTLSCGTRLYDHPYTPAPPPQLPPYVEPARDWRLPSDGVIPDASRLEGREWHSLLAEPPFVPPPSGEFRSWNYWMMSQRAGSISYVTFATGFALALFAAFYVACDLWGWRSRLFETLGVNALAGYVLHDLVDGCVSSFAPKDSPDWWMWGAFAVYFWICWLFLRTLEKSGIFLRL
jgi:predicted acyltransferase